jgi:hypothetical protein
LLRLGSRSLLLSRRVHKNIGSRSKKNKKNILAGMNGQDPLLLNLVTLQKMH